MSRFNTIITSDLAAAGMSTPVVSSTADTETTYSDIWPSSAASPAAAAAMGDSFLPRIRESSEKDIFKIIK